MKKIYMGLRVGVIVMVGIVVFPGKTSAQVSLNMIGTAYSQDFNSLANSGTNNTWTNNVTIPGWYSNQNSYRGDNGNMNAGDLYSYGTNATNERALGGLSSGTVTPLIFGLRLKNNTGSLITSFLLSFTGEQWRQNATGVLQFSYQLNATSINLGTWNNVTNFDFTSLQTGSGDPIDGNLSANRTGITGLLSVNLPAGEELWIRWSKTGPNSPGLAIDDFSVVPYSAKYYRTKQSGSWTDNSIWESSSNNSTWSNATSYPNSGDYTITVQAAHIVTVSSSINLDETIVYGTLDVQTGGFLSIFDGTSNDITIKNGGILLSQSTSGYTTVFGYYWNAQMAVENGGIIRINNNSGGGMNGFATSTFPDVIWNTGAIFDWNTSSTFATNGLTYFNSVNSSTIPIFRVSALVGSPGGGSPTAINGLLEVNSNFSWSGNGLKTMRDGIIGTSILTFSSGSSGGYTIGVSGASPIIGGNVTLILNQFVRLYAGVTIPTGASVTIDGGSTNNIAKGSVVSGSFIVNGTADLKATNISNTSGNVTVSGTLKTGNLNGLYGTTATIINGTLLINAGSTIDYNAFGDQAVQGSLTYSNLTFSGSGTKTLSSSNSPSATVTIKDAAILNAGANTFGASSPSLVMTGSSTFKMAGTGSKPDFAGNTYNLGLSSTIEFTNTLPTTQDIRVTNVSYAKVVVSGTSVANNGTLVGIPFQAGGTFTVKTGAVYKLNTTAGFAASISNNPTITLEDGSTVEYTGVSQTITNTIDYKNLSIVGTGTHNAPSTTLTIQGNLSKSGTSTFAHNNGTVLLSGTALQTYTAAAPVMTFNNLTNNNTFGVDIKGDLSVYKALAMGANSKLNLVSGNITLLSSAANTANVGVIPTTATITYGTGKFIVERFIKTPRKWQLLSVPTNSTQTIKTSWMEGGGIIANYGTHVTDNNSGTYIGNGFDAYSPGGPSVKAYSPVSDSWVGIANTTPKVLSGDSSYIVFVRGDRSQTNPSIANSTTTLRTSGQLMTGTQIRNVPAGFGHVGNPYASAVNLYNISKTNLAGSDIYLWDPALAGSYGVGKYQTLAPNNTNLNYDVVPGGGGSYPATWNSIESGQAFFVRAAIGGATITFNEANKLTSSFLVTSPSGPPSTDQKLRANIFQISNSGNLLIDGIMAKFDDANSNDTTDDAVKFINTGENVGLLRSGKLFSIERRKDISASDTLFLNTTGLTVNNYHWQIPITDMDVPGRTGFLYDSYISKYFPLNLSDTNYINFNITSDPASAAANRFIIVFSQLAPVPVKITSIAAQRQADKSIAVNWKVENEINISGYELQRSADGRNFSALASKAATSNNGSSAVYQHYDAVPLSNDNFYRVKATSQNGQVQYSAIVKVAQQKGLPSISVYPNPVEGKLIQLRFQDKETGTYSIRLSDASGAVLYKGTQQVNQVNVTRPIQLPSSIAAGQYKLQIQKDGAEAGVISVTIL